ncbi:hypothetical protein MJO28_015705 [Puccinia striiformis f. sp. tritici]|uniref:Uncharacterized protein n=1 Tax=Puccinia striiformis f. sp. tritici TaxID=168172 RepID=A0ACC0DPF5_9BASI|nr:hypothetical protein MJO28_015705 [Puccinia striiformis f. sp. tritici]
MGTLIGLLSTSNSIPIWLLLGTWNLIYGACLDGIQDFVRESPARSIQLSPNLSQQIEFLLPIKINDFISA